MIWNKKTYARELKKGYWDLELHYHYYAQFKLFVLFKTFYKNKMSVEDCNSAMYGEFVIEGKPIIKGFYGNMNLMSKFLDKLIKKHTKKSKNEKQGNNEKGG